MVAGVSLGSGKVLDFGLAGVVVAGLRTSSRVRSSSSSDSLDGSSEALTRTPTGGFAVMPSSTGRSFPFPCLEAMLSFDPSLDFDLDDESEKDRLPSLERESLLCALSLDKDEGSLPVRSPCM